MLVRIDADPGGLKKTIWLEVMQQFNCKAVSYWYSTSRTWARTSNGDSGHTHAHTPRQELLCVGEREGRRGFMDGEGEGRKGKASLPLPSPLQEKR